MFSPDGSKIAFTSDRSGDFDVWLMDPDGSNQTNLTNHPAETSIRSGPATASGSPSPRIG